jgi:hypothetical protein
VSRVDELLGLFTRLGLAEDTSQPPRIDIDSLLKQSAGGDPSRY